MIARFAESPDAVTRPSVWVVDDSPLQAESCRAALSDRNEVRVYGDGVAVLEALGTEPPPDVLVTDWEMPDLSGLDLCRFVRTTQDAAQLPILILTATATSDSVLEAFSAGANDFVRKPCCAAELDSRVVALVHGKRLHARLARTEASLRVEGEFRERFIGMLAHDLRQPLATFSLANDALVRAEPGEDPLPFLRIQKRASERMARMISELLDFTRSRPSSGMPVDRRLVDFESVAREVVEEMRIGHPGRILDLAVEGSCDGHWDRDRLAQVCSNLIGNALEHGVPAEAPIRIGLRGQGHEVELTISNRGGAISQEVLLTLFEPFRRGRSSARATGGVGLGLHIVSEIVRAHGGAVDARSDPEETIFSVRLPTAPPDLVTR